MNLATKERVLEIANVRRGAISADKGPEYAGSATRYSDSDQDVLANFKRQGVRWGTSPLLPTGVYFGKHIDSIETFVREATRDGISVAEQREIAARGEGVVSRLDDARNYLDLMECLLIDLGIVDSPLAPQEQAEERASLLELGDVQPEDLTHLIYDEAEGFAEDYNYMRRRVQALETEKVNLEAQLGAANALAEEMYRH